MQAGTHRITLRAKDEDTVRIKLDFIQFVVKLYVSKLHTSLFFSVTKGCRSSSGPTRWHPPNDKGSWGLYTKSYDDLKNRCG